MKRFALIFLFSGLLTCALAEDKKKVVYKYKKYERIDLGDMEVQGDVVAPGDLSVKQRRRRVFKRNLYMRLEFNKETTRDLMNFR